MARIFEQVGNHLELSIVPGKAELVKERKPGEQIDLQDKFPYIQEIKPSFALRLVFEEKDAVIKAAVESLDLDQAENLVGKMATAIQEYKDRLAAATKDFKLLESKKAKEG